MLRVRVGFLALALPVAVAMAGYGGGKAAAAPTTTPAVHRSMDTPTWSPDGAQIAWAELSGANGRIWLASSDGSNAHPIAHPIDALYQLAWLPGNQLLYDANSRLFRLPLRTLRPFFFDSGAGDSFTTNRAGTISAWGTPGCPLCGGPIRVRSLVGGRTTSIGGGKVQNISPTLSPNGRLVAFTRIFWSKAGGEYDQPAGIWVSSTVGGPLKRLTRSGGCSNWSPDGRRLVYVDGSDIQLATGHGSLRLVSASGGSSVLLLRGNATCNSFPTWSPDSRSVAFLNGTSGQLLVVSLATHRAKALTGTAIGPVGKFAWSPDSTKLLVTARSRTTACSILWAVSVSGSAKRLRRTC